LGSDEGPALLFKLHNGDVTMADRFIVGAVEKSVSEMSAADLEQAFLNLERMRREIAAEVRQAERYAQMLEAGRPPKDLTREESEQAISVLRESAAIDEKLARLYEIVGDILKQKGWAKGETFSQAMKRLWPHGRKSAG
jgi:hypothetical protein